MRYPDIIDVPSKIYGYMNKQRGVKPSTVGFKRVKTNSVSKDFNFIRRCVYLWYFYLSAVYPVDVYTRPSFLFV